MHVWLIIRIDYDSLENHDPVTERVLGYVGTHELAQAAMAALDRESKKYEGGPLPGMGRPEYPKFRADRVPELVT